MRTATSFVLLAGLAGTASANAFFINEHDAKVTGRAGASTATDTDASSIVFNVGGLAVGDGTQADIATKSSLRTYYITPAVGLNLDQQVPGLSVGAGLDLVPATVELEQAIIFGDPTNGGTQGKAHLGGTAFGIGGRVGVMYRPP